MRFTPRWHDTHPIWKWHKWFAWHPVFIKRLGKQVWLERVYRKRVRSGSPFSRDPYEFVYEVDEVGILQYDAEQEGAGQRTEVEAVYMAFYRDVADSGSMVL